MAAESRMSAGSGVSMVVVGLVGKAEPGAASSRPRDRVGSVHCGAVLICAVAMVSVWLSIHQARKPASNSRKPGIAVPLEPPQWQLPDDQLARRLERHYQVGHGEMATNYVSRREIKKALILTLARYASEGDVALGFELTDTLFPGFCPPDLTDTIADLREYAGPGGRPTLNDWIIQVKRMKFRAKVSRGDAPSREGVHPLDWWILFCGALEELESPQVARCRGDMEIPLIRLMGRDGIVHLLDGFMPLILDARRGDSATGAPAPGVTLPFLEPVEHLRECAGLLPDHFKDIHYKYSEEYVRLIRTLYGLRPTDGGTAEGRSRFDRNCRERVEEYLEDLLKGVRVDAVIEFAE